MAKAISYIERKLPTDEELQAESLADVLKAISDNRQAILAFLDILKEMENSGMLDIIRGIMKNRTSLGSVGMEFINVAKIPNMLKNVIMASQFLGRIEPKDTEKLINGLDSGLKKAMKKEEESISMLGLLGLLRDPDVKTTLSKGLHLLQGMGKSLNSK
ncbi:DUF1641 domain-containing protein [Paenibacillus sp. GP183]|uniref:DUF1641 domain-containing protein n=1 Tax=Paenibacillus sp. GP183 TaxID=1882751 RepID=UPI00089CABA3|nr:DUF1641 domain-containing protein [Paenibacillus sp. GP183]SEB48262.1 Uncharacterized conserved protein YjgD, DUF1641 family [Paenibacillus sp. GP183]